MIAFRDREAQRLGRRSHRAYQRAGRARRHLADHPWQRALYRHHEDARPEAGARRHTASTRRSAARGATRRSRAPRSASSRSATPRTVGTRSASGRSCGISSTRKSSPARACACSRCRTGPSSTSGHYIHLEDIPVVPLYFAADRPVVERDGMLIMVDDDRLPHAIAARSPRCGACASARSAAIR